MSSIRVLRQLASAGRAIHSARILPRTSFAVVSASARLSTPVRTFSVSRTAFGQGSTDVALSQKLQEELAYETESETEQGEPSFLKEFKAQGVWKIEEKPYHDEVTLTRGFGNENLRLMFSIADVQADPDEDFVEEEDGSEDSAKDGEEENPDQPLLQTFPIRASLTITKNSSPACLSIDMSCQEGAFIIENIGYYRDAKVGSDLTADADWARRGLYMGPQFDSIDVGLQEQIEAFLQERGVNEAVAMFIPEFAEYKEQKEYVQWLKGLKEFVDA